MLGFIYGMIHCFLEDEQTKLLEDVYQRQNKLELWINFIHHHMEDTLQKTEQSRKLSSPALLANFIQRLF